MLKLPIRLIWMTLVKLSSRWGPSRPTTFSGRHAGAVDQAVEAAEDHQWYPPHSGCCLHRPRRSRQTCSGAQFGRQLLAAGFAIEVGEDHLAARRHQRFRRFRAQTEPAPVTRNTLPAICILSLQPLSVMV